MPRNIKVEQLHQVPIEKQEVEIVERKGVGHPGSIADGLAESVSRALSREYSRILSQIGHHIDQPLIANAQIITDNDMKMNGIKSEADAIIDQWLDNITKITGMIVEGKVTTF